MSRRKEQDSMIYQMVGARIRDIREGLGMTQVDLAKRTGIGRTTLVYIESGKHCTSLGKLYKIAETLDVSVYSIVPERNDFGEQSIRELFQEFLAEKLRRT